MRFIPRQEVSKKVVDAQHPEVTAWRYECVQCGCTFRVYLEGVSEKQISKRINEMAVMLYLIGLSYGAVEIVLGSLGLSIGKTSVYRAVQPVAEKVPGMRQEELMNGYKTKAVGADVTSVRCNGKWIPIGITVDATNGRVLIIDQLPGEDAEQLKAWLEPILDAVDADGYWPSQWWIIRYPLWTPKRGQPVISTRSGFFLSGFHAGLNLFSTLIQESGKDSNSNGGRSSAPPAPMIAWGRACAILPTPPVGRSSSRCGIGSSACGG